MRYAILSDIHANLEALRAALARIGKLRADRIVCLGDVVGYNADPNACADIIRSRGIPCVLGNHDAAACGLTEPDNFNAAARAAALWTRDVLTAENKVFLRGLPKNLMMDNMVLCHGSINDTNHYLLYEQDVRDNFDVLASIRSRPEICFYGHTHIRSAHSMRKNILARIIEDRIELADQTIYCMNPGGMGQPRDSDPDAPFLIYDTVKRTISFHRVKYDIAACQGKILRAGLPARLAERLALGR